MQEVTERRGQALADWPWNLDRTVNPDRRLACGVCEVEGWLGVAYDEEGGAGRRFGGAGSWHRKWDSGSWSWLQLSFEVAACVRIEQDTRLLESYAECIEAWS
jgi:hypothetical protein